MGPLGWQETLVIFVLALLIFGPKKLPELGKNIGKALTEFRRASSDLRSTWDREMAAMERETEPIRQELNQQIHSGSYSDSGYYDSDPYGDSYNATGANESNPSTVSASAIQGAESTDASGDGTQASGEVTPEQPAEVAGETGEKPVSSPESARA